MDEIKYMKLIMLKGLPGSGKSTWAKQMSRNNQQYVRVNKDNIRDMIGYTPHREGLVLNIRDAVITLALEYKHVIVDDTNFHPKHEKRLREIATLTGSDFEEKFFDVPLDDCIKNDLKREVSVGEKVIRKMWREYLYKKYPAPDYNSMLQDAVICDLDGTLCLHNGRSPYDTKKCSTDLINHPIHAILWRWQKGENKNIIFVSGREDRFRERTIDWIGWNTAIKDFSLFMRPTGDLRKDDIVKEEIYLTKILNKYNVHFVLDDRNRVVDMWRRNGLTCLQVAEGDF